MKLNREMSASTVVELLHLLETEGIIVWMDGGWAVDALLDEQTRTHSDLDLVVKAQDVQRMRLILEARTYTDQERDNTTEWNFVLGDAAGHDVDLHVVTLDANGDGIYGPPEQGMRYPKDSLTGRGVINGYPVRCISPEWLVKFHTGYAFDAQDVEDVLALHKRFGVALPTEYVPYSESCFPAS
jgi:lincosamide nucleotidyltransferase A/C/D/E